MEGLETFAPEPRRVDLRGRVIDVLPLRLRDWTRFARAVEPVLPQVLAGDLVGAILDNEDAVFAAVAIGAGLTPADLDDILPDEMLALASAVIEVNADFFVRRVVPAAQAATARMNGVLAGLRPGPSSSPGSSSADTPSSDAST